MSNNLQYHLNPSDNGTDVPADVLEEYYDYSASVELYDDIARKPGHLWKDGKCISFGEPGWVLTGWSEEEYPALSKWLLENVPTEYYSITRISYNG